MTRDSGCHVRLPRRTKGPLATALLAIFIAVQPWATCPVTCLLHGHAAVTSSHHHGHGQPCHDRTQVRNVPPSVQGLGDMLSALQMPQRSPRGRAAIPAGPAVLGERHPTLPAEPPPPRPA